MDLNLFLRNGLVFFENYDILLIVDC